MRKTVLFSLLAALVSAAIGSSLSRMMMVQGVQAQDSQRLLTQSLGVTHGQYLVADLASFPDGATKLVLRDPNGRVGMILAVSDRAGAERARIEFYDAGGVLVQALSASSSAGPLEERVQTLERISLPASAQPGGRSPFSNTQNLWIRLDDLDQRVRHLEGKP